LVKVKEIIPDIEIELKYSTTDNFTKQILYPTNTCYLAFGTLENLKLVQDSLRNIYSHNGSKYSEGLGLKIWDGYRPQSVQYRMWEIIPDSRYVADPNKGSSHNRGGAVDLTIIDFSTKRELDMPTIFDFFGVEAHHEYMDHPDHVIVNRELLKNLMTNVGSFIIYAEEWWHYKYPPSDNFPLLDFQPE
jgi:D-alanyl-D-alanine dipeptidase